MTERERQIMELLRQNPMLSQGELAKHLGITRSSVGVHLANLGKKGHILRLRATSSRTRRSGISWGWGPPTST